MKPLKKINSVYISAPMSTVRTDVHKAADLFEKENIDVEFWSKGTVYNESRYTKIIQEADAFVIFLPDNKFKLPINQLTRGIKSEYGVAVMAGVPIYLAYHSGEGVGIYDIEEGGTKGGYVSGIGGTRNHIFKINKEIERLQAEYSLLVSRLRDQIVIPSQRITARRRMDDIKVKLGLNQPIGLSESTKAIFDNSTSMSATIDAVDGMVKAMEDADTMLPLAEIKVAGNAIVSNEEWTWNMTKADYERSAKFIVMDVSNDIFVNNNNYDERLLLKL